MLNTATKERSQAMMRFAKPAKEQWHIQNALDGLVAKIQETQLLSRSLKAHPRPKKLAQS